MIKGMALGKSGSKISLLLGFSLAVVATILIVVYLTSVKGDSGGGGGGPTVPVVVASQNINAGTRLTAEMLAVKSVAEDSLLPGAFDKTDAVVNQVTTVPIVAGEQVIPAKVTATGAQAASEFGAHPPIALVVQDGQRGTSVEFNSIVGAGGNVRPGDHVDVILSVKTDVLGPNGEKSGSDQIAATILQDLQVLAIDQSIATTSTTDKTSSSTDSAKATTATLLTSPSQAEVLALADSCRKNFEGRLAISVRGFGDDSRFAPRSEWPSDGRPPTCASLFGIQSLP